MISKITIRIPSAINPPILYLFLLNKNYQQVLNFFDCFVYLLCLVVFFLAAVDTLSYDQLHAFDRADHDDLVLLDHVRGID